MYDVGALPRHARRARSLVGERAERYFESWLHGPTPLHRQLARGINQLMSLACYEQPAMMERLGYRPAPWIEEVTHHRLTVFRDDVRRQAEQILAPDPLRPGVRIKREACVVVAVRPAVHEVAAPRNVFTRRDHHGVQRARRRRRDRRLGRRRARRWPPSSPRPGST